MKSSSGASSRPAASSSSSRAGSGFGSAFGEADLAIANPFLRPTGFSSSDKGVSSEPRHQGVAFAGMNYLAFSSFHVLEAFRSGKKAVDC
jgi:hypothetical protein